DRLDLQRCDAGGAACLVDAEQDVRGAAVRVARRGGEHAIVVEHGDARGRRRGIEAEDLQWTRNRMMSLRDASRSTSRITARPTCWIRSFAFGDSGRRRAPSIAKISRCPP